MKRVISILLSLSLVSLIPIAGSCKPEETPVPEEPAVEEPEEPETPDTPDTPGEDLDTPQTDPGDGIVRILAIGNSFSQDAVEQYLYDLFDAAGIKVIIGNMYIGGCSLETHWTNASAGNAAYYYRKIVDGTKTETSGVTLSAGIEDEKWDYISLQQVSGKSGVYSTYSPYLADLIGYVKAHAKKADVSIMLHQTWAYQTGSTHSDFPTYGSDQMTMYNAIVDAERKAAEDNSISIVIPSGTAIQNGRTTYLGDSFNRDGYHLEITYGRYTAACTWFETISGKNVVGNGYHPDTIDNYVAKLAQSCAHAAVQSPWTVTVMSEFATPEIVDKDMSKPVCIDFGGGSTASPEGWNKVAVYKTDAPVYLKNTSDEYSVVRIKALEGFTGTHNGVGSEPDSAITIGEDSYAKAVWSDGIIVSGTKGQGNAGPANVVLSGFDTAARYMIRILAVRYNGSAAARECRYVVKGKEETESKSIFPGLKTYDTAAGDFSGYQLQFSDIVPASDGTITVSVTGVDTSLAADGLISALVISRANSL